MTQYDLYDGIPPHEKTKTSLAAAHKIKPDATTLRSRVFALIRKHGGLTDEEGIALSGIAANTYRPRRRELVLKGRVVDCGQTRKTESGRAATVWKINEEST